MSPSRLLFPRELSTHARPFLCSYTHALYMKVSTMFGQLSAWNSPLLHVVFLWLMRTCLPNHVLFFPSIPFFPSAIIHESTMCVLANSSWLWANMHYGWRDDAHAWNIQGYKLNYARLIIALSRLSLSRMKINNCCAPPSFIPLQ